jgi:hypothetical protein
MMSTAAMLLLVALVVLALTVDVAVVINWLRRKR